MFFRDEEYRYTDDVYRRRYRVIRLSLKDSDGWACLCEMNDRTGTFVVTFLSEEKEGGLGRLLQENIGVNERAAIRGWQEGRSGKGI